jgi:hypothetical protein
MSQRDALLDELGIGRLWVLRDRGGIAEAQETPLVRDHEARSAEAQETPLVQAQEARFAEAQMAPFAEAERTPLADSHETSLAQTTDRPLSDRHVPSGRSDLSAEPDRPTTPGSKATKACSTRRAASPSMNRPDSRRVKRAVLHCRALPSSISRRSKLGSRIAPRVACAKSAPKRYLASATKMRTG